MQTDQVSQNHDQANELAQLRAEVATFNQQMHARAQQPDAARKAWLPFGLGAGLAFGLFVFVTLLQRLA